MITRSNRFSVEALGGYFLFLFSDDLNNQRDQCDDNHAEQKKLIPSHHIATPFLRKRGQSKKYVPPCLSGGTAYRVTGSTIVNVTYFSIKRHKNRSSKMRSQPFPGLALFHPLGLFSFRVIVGADGAFVDQELSLAGIRQVDIPVFIAGLVFVVAADGHLPHPCGLVPEGGQIQIAL